MRLYILVLLVTIMIIGNMISCIASDISFISPTPNNNDYVCIDSVTINTSITNSTNSSSFFDWNNSLIVWYRFDNETGENNTHFDDWSSYDNNATCSNCPIYSTSRFDEGLAFDGIDDVLTASKEEIRKDISINFWINLTNSSPTFQNIIDVSLIAEYNIWSRPSWNTLALKRHYLYPYKEVSQECSDLSMTVGNFENYHIVQNFDSREQNTKFYKNGELKCTVANPYVTFEDGLIYVDNGSAGNGTYEISTENPLNGTKSLKAESWGKWNDTQIYKHFNNGNETSVNNTDLSGEFWFTANGTNTHSFELELSDFFNNSGVTTASWASMRYVFNENGISSHNLQLWTDNGTKNGEWITIPHENNLSEDNTYQYVKFSVNHRDHHYNYIILNDVEIDVSSISTIWDSYDRPTGVWYWLSLKSTYLTNESNKNVMYCDDIRLNIDVRESIGSMSIGDNLNGTLDELRIFDRVLSDTEINASYDSGSYDLYNTFSNLYEGEYTLQSHMVNSSGLVTSISERTVNIDYCRSPTQGHFYLNMEENCDVVSGYFNTDNLILQKSGTAKLQDIHLTADKIVLSGSENQRLVFGDNVTIALERI